MVEQEPVEVLFVDADSGDTIARSDVPGDQLPQSFADASTTVQLQGVPWTVVAEPPHASLFRAWHQLTLRVRRQQLLDPQEILFSLPTICDALPAVVDPDPATLLGDRLILDEDDWRQVELVAATALPAVEQELTQIGDIFDRHTHHTVAGIAAGFTQTHVRTPPTEPLAGSVSRTALLDLCRASGGRLGSVGFRGVNGFVPGAFVVPIGPAHLYAVADGDIVHVLGLDLDNLHTMADAATVVTALDPVMREFGLVLVAWCQATTITADQLPAYLDWLVR
jgi:hypothetical protein